jgi:hypothetical protein
VPVESVEIRRRGWEAWIDKLNERGYAFDKLNEREVSHWHAPDHSRTPFP